MSELVEKIKGCDIKKSIRNKLEFLGYSLYFCLYISE